MTISQSPAAPFANGSYALSLGLVTATSAASGFLFWEWSHSTNVSPLLSAGLAGAAALATTGVTLDAQRRWRRMRAAKRRGTPLPPRPGVTERMELLTRTILLALPPPSWWGLKSMEHSKQEPQMEKPNAASTTQGPSKRTAPVDREYLRKAGLTDEEIQIVLGAQAGAGARAPLGTGVATGVINNLDVVMSHLRSLVPSVKFDLARILDRHADAPTRISGAISLGVKAIAAVVIGYFVYLEAMTLRSTAYEAWAKACIARQQNEINFSTPSDLLTTLGNALDRECGPK